MKLSQQAEMEVTDIGSPGTPGVGLVIFGYIAGDWGGRSPAGIEPPGG